MALVVENRTIVFSEDAARPVLNTASFVLEGGRLRGTSLVGSLSLDCLVHDLWGVVFFVIVSVVILGNREVAATRVV